MSEAERYDDRLAAARAHPGLATAMATPPTTWLTLAVVVVAVMALSIVLTVAFYPWDDLDRIPEGVRAILMVSWVPTIAASVASLWLLIDALRLASRPTRHLLAVAEPGPRGPAPFVLDLVTEDGQRHRCRARRRAASVVKLGLVTPGDVGVAVCKGEDVVEWVPLPPVPAGRVYDRV